MSAGPPGVVPIEAVSAVAYSIPTDAPESDGTFAWTATTIVVVSIRAGAREGLGYSYTDAVAAALVRDRFAPLLQDADAMAIPARWQELVGAVRNIGRPGLCATAIAAVDVALWDLKAKLLGIPLVRLLGAARDSVPVYGSGGFTSYAVDRLAEQLMEWTGAGISMVKMKVGREPAADVARVRAARAAIGTQAGLFVDANGAYDRKQALAKAEQFATAGVSWFEEPVSSDDLEGLRLLRDRAPAGMDIAAGEYGYDETYFRRMLASGAVDVLQADATRCAGITGLLTAAGLCRAFHVRLSTHCAPALHLHPGCAIPEIIHLEYFHDHTRIETMLFDGVATPVNGCLVPSDRPGLGLEFRHVDAERFRL
jgi:L-alanine-DL-glutamate epimerase-like enolase superfamily enzyme